MSNQIHKCFICLIYIFVFNFYPLSNFIEYKIYTTFLKSHTYEISSIHTVFKTFHFKSYQFKIHKYYSHSATYGINQYTNQFLRYKYTLDK